MKTEVVVNGFNGNILVAKHGKIIYQAAYGYRNYNTKEPLDNNSVFELASVSKQFTAMGILQLADKGLLKLSDSLRKFIPELPYNNITIWQLLVHTAGLPEYGDAMSQKWDHKKVAFNKDAIEFLSKENLPVNFKPGERWEYSNTAYDLLASIIERVSGKSFNDYLQVNIFKPLGMQHSTVYDTRRSSDLIIPDYAYGYVFSDSLKRFIIPDSLPGFDYVVWGDGIVGSGVVNSTTGDLLKWDRAIKNHSLLSPETNAGMISPQALVDTASMLYYGYGVLLGKNDFGDFILHTGGWPGYRTSLFRYLKDDITIIVLSNNELVHPLYVTGVINYILNDRKIVMPYKHIMVPVDKMIPGKFTGRYRIESIPYTSTLKIKPAPAIIVLSEKDGMLMYNFENQPELTGLKPESETKFFNDSKPDTQFEFELDKKGNVTRAYYIVHGMKNEIKKLN